ncbi:MAG: hypothetical protein IJ841_12030 [Prevotella sp.]|nr:hypothetical protein [Prevotella sp.]
MPLMSGFVRSIYQSCANWCRWWGVPSKAADDGSKRLADNTLVALTLMIAESRTEEKDVMVKVVVNLINQKN